MGTGQMQNFEWRDDDEVPPPWHDPKPISNSVVVALTLALASALALLNVVCAWPQ